MLFFYIKLTQTLKDLAKMCLLVMFVCIPRGSQKDSDRLLRTMLFPNCSSIINKCVDSRDEPILKLPIPTVDYSEQRLPMPLVSFY